MANCEFLFQGTMVLCGATAKETVGGHSYCEGHAQIIKERTGYSCPKCGKRKEINPRCPACSGVGVLSYRELLAYQNAHPRSKSRPTSFAADTRHAPDGGGASDNHKAG